MAKRRLKLWNCFGREIETHTNLAIRRSLKSNRDDTGWAFVSTNDAPEPFHLIMISREQNLLPNGKWSKFLYVVSESDDRVTRFNRNGDVVTIYEVEFAESEIKEAVSLFLKLVASPYKKMLYNMRESFSPVHIFTS